MNGILGGWQISAIVQARSGEALRVTQSSGIDRSRPDVVEGVDLILDDWKDTCTATGCNYLNTAGFVRVPVSTVTNATLRPGTYMMDMARGPGRLDNNLTIAKSFGLGSGSRLQVRADIFNALNRKNFSNPQQAITNVDFGRITGASSARVVQFGGRLTF
jgi:hypothetical protein